MLHYLIRGNMFPDVVSILTRPRGRVLLLHLYKCNLHSSVSILTRPRGRVLLALSAGQRHGKKVSILTRPRGRVLQGMAIPF